MADGYEIFDGDFEEEVWAVMKEERKDGSPKSWKAKESTSPTPKRLPSASRLIPKSNGCGGEAKGLQRSAPVNIPDWSKIYNNKVSSEVSEEENAALRWFGDDVDEEEDDEEWIPPHEWIAKKLARSQVSSFSVFEGVGRTLKGRDLSKVRNAVLTRTGFIE